MPDIDPINKKYAFPAVGETEEENFEKFRRGREKSIVQSNYGFKFPLKIDESGEGFAVHNKALDAISDNLHHLILTNHGERVGNYYFGANLFPLLMEGSSTPNFESEVGLRIQNAISKFMPFVEPQEFSVNFIARDNEPTQKVEINLSYLVPLIGNEVKIKKIVMYLGA